MNDVRDEALGALLERAADGIESTPVDRLPEVIRRGSRRRATRFTAIAAAVGVFVGAVSWAGLQNEGRGRIPADIADWDTFASLEDNGWTVQVPPPWRVQELPACPNAPERIGVIVTNTDFIFRDPRGEPPSCGERQVFAGFPRDGVVFQFQPWGDFGFFRHRLPDSPFPLSAGSLQHSGGIQGGPTESNTAVSVNGRIIGIVRRYVGPEASQRDIAALDRMLSSLQVRGGVRWIDDEVTTVDEFPDLTVTIRRPETWRIETYSTSDVIDAPNPIVALRSPGLGHGRCQLAFFTRTDRFSDADLLVVISDATGSWVAPDLGPRPDAFRFDDAIDSGELRCGTGRTFRWGFEEAGRQIHVDVAVGEWFYRERPEMILEIVDSIRVSRVPEA